MESQSFITDDTKLAAYLCLMGYEAPKYIQGIGRTVKYEFGHVEQYDVLNFYNRKPSCFAALDIFMKHDEIIAKSKIMMLGIRQEIFEPAS